MSETALLGKSAIRAALALILLACSFAGCGSAPPEQHHPFQGEIVAIGPTKKLLTVQHGDIPGFMPAMTMSYTVAVPKEADNLKVGDEITADLVVSDGRSRLEKIVRVEDSKASAPGGSEKK